MFRTRQIWRDGRANLPGAWILSEVDCFILLSASVPYIIAVINFAKYVSQVESQLSKLFWMTKFLRRQARPGGTRCSDDPYTYHIALYRVGGATSGHGCVDFLLIFSVYPCILSFDWITTQMVSSFMVSQFLIFLPSDMRPNVQFLFVGTLVNSISCPILLTSQYHLLADSFSLNSSLYLSHHPPQYRLSSPQEYLVNQLWGCIRLQELPSC